MNSSAARLNAMGTDPSRALPLALVVEDDPDAASIAQSMLKLCGFRTRHAASANTALVAASEERPDLILLDVCLPDMNGVGFMQVMNRLPGFAETKVLAASALYPEKGPIGDQLRKLGVNHYLDKPFTVAAMRAKLTQLFPEMRHETAPSRPSLRDVEALSLPATVEYLGEQRPIRLLAATPKLLIIKGQKVPVGQTVTIRLQHQQIVFDEPETFDLVAMTTVARCDVVMGTAVARLDVLVTRPPLEFDRMCAELPDPT